ncbi:hypothetical protein BC936DRAFT_148816 [Jimgerdemannia flammicorona]|uniref:Hemicentin-1-like von Willebrand factor A domain-containing protein n=1 Tax=Jimgerdemannia flammicorona TaxID=994334 RepID=A0A433D274_9FUNG|nr:hypothetical protein BC936DRAFT_148816 [Jimgerdemannia flammicorona]
MAYRPKNTSRDTSKPSDSPLQFLTDRDLPSYHTNPPSNPSRRVISSRDTSRPSDSPLQFLTDSDLPSYHTNPPSNPSRRVISGESPLYHNDGRSFVFDGGYGGSHLPEGSTARDAKSRVELPSSRHKARADNNKTEFIDVAFLVDVTASMQTWIDAVYDKLDSIIDAINRTWPFVVMRTAFIGYRDYGDAQQLVLKDFENNPDEMKRFVRTVKATGGDDMAEDVLGGMDALRTLSWKSKVRIVFHVGDAPAHGARFHKSHVQDFYPRGDPRGLVAEDVLRGIYEKGIIYYFLKLNDSTDQMIEVFNVMSSLYHKKMETKSMNSSPENFLPIVVNSISSSIRQNRFRN